MIDFQVIEAELIHKIKSKKIKDGSLLLILDYDYFLQKRDFYFILNNFHWLIFLPYNKNSIEENIRILESINKSEFKKVKIIYNLYTDAKIKNHLINIFSLRNFEFLSVNDFCEKSLKKCYVPDDINHKNNVISNLQYFNFKTRLFKKLIDWVIGTTLYIITQPIWLISCFKIYLESPGPIFFKQKRVGIRNNEFKVIKFRSMSVDAELYGAQFSSKNDNRIFPFGKIMRTTRIDELPQLFNIIKGELSLIGPRPERNIFVNDFAEEIPHYNERHAVKPGISGYAQIMYPYGAGAKDARHKLMYDLYYIKNWTYFLEIKILLKTIITVVTKKGM